MIFAKDHISAKDFLLQYKDRDVNFQQMSSYAFGDIVNQLANKQTQVSISIPDLLIAPVLLYQVQLQSTKKITLVLRQVWTCPFFKYNGHPNFHLLSTISHNYFTSLFTIIIYCLLYQLKYHSNQQSSMLKRKGPKTSKSKEKRFKVYPN